MMKLTATSTTTILALDVGERRIGVARANTIARLPEPLTTLINDQTIFDKLNEIIQKERVISVIIGLPRGMNGQETKQTGLTRKFIKEFQGHFSIPVYLQDEALTSKKAEQELRDSTKKQNKDMIDSLAATYILEDFLLQDGKSEEVINE